MTNPRDNRRTPPFLTPLSAESDAYHPSPPFSAGSPIGSPSAGLLKHTRGRHAVLSRRPGAPSIGVAPQAHLVAGRLPLRSPRLAAVDRRCRWAYVDRGGGVTTSWLGVAPLQPGLLGLIGLMRLGCLCHSYPNEQASFQELNSRN
jgi:hypothetical protein